MKTLVVAEHDNAALKAATLNAVAAAATLGGEVDILVAGAGCSAAADAALRRSNDVALADASTAAPRPARAALRAGSSRRRDRLVAQSE